MKYALFLGCTIPARSRNYEMAARAVSARLGLELVDLPEFSCCGFPLKSSDARAALFLAARNLALAEEKDLPVVTLCSSCNSMLKEAAYRLQEIPGLMDEVNRGLEKIGRRYNGGARIKHFARVLLEDVGLERIAGAATRRLDGLRVANHYGCHYLKPAEIYAGGEDPEYPESLDLILREVGAESVRYGLERNCCGGPVLVSHEDTALLVARQKLEAVKSSGAHAMNLVCPFCSVMYDGNQKTIESRFDASYGIPVLYLPQIIGLAFGLDRKDLGLNMNVVKTKPLIELIDRNFHP